MSQARYSRRKPGHKKREAQQIRRIAIKERSGAHQSFERAVSREHVGRIVDDERGRRSSRSSSAMVDGSNATLTDAEHLDVPECERIEQRRQTVEANTPRI